MAKIMVLGSMADSLINFRGPLLKDMVSRGNEVYACAPDASSTIKKSLVEMGVIYRNIRMERTGLNPFKDLAALKYFISLIYSIKPDVFLGYTIKPVIYGSLAARLTGVKRIFSIITGLGYIFTERRLQNRMLGCVVAILYRLVLSFNKKVFFQNTDDASLFLRKGFLKTKEQVVLINGSGVDINFFYPASYPPTVSFLLIARLIRYKGIYEYVEAAERVKKRYPATQFYLVGWIDSNPNCINERDLQVWQEKGVITYLGQMDDVRPAIRDCSVYVLPSYYREGTPRTVLEAMAMGRPIITSDSPGCRQTVQAGENGYLVPVRDVDKLSKAMELFIKEPSLVERMGRVSRKIAVEKYDVRKVNAVILNAMGLSE